MIFFLNLIIFCLYCTNMFETYSNLNCQNNFCKSNNCSVITGYKQRYNCGLRQDDVNSLRNMEFKVKDSYWKDLALKQMNQVDYEKAAHEKTQKNCFFCGMFCWGIHADHYKVCTDAEWFLDQEYSKQQILLSDRTEFEYQREKKIERINFYDKVMAKRKVEKKAEYLAYCEEAKDYYFEEQFFMHVDDDDQYYGPWEQKADFSISPRTSVFQKKTNKKKKRQPRQLPRQPTKKFKLDHKSDRQTVRLLQEPLESLLVDLPPIPVPVFITPSIGRKMYEKAQKERNRQRSLDSEVDKLAMELFVAKEALEAALQIREMFY